MGEQVAARLRRRIRQDGPLAFDEFMREALYGPGGFYDDTPVGERGHFVTGPHAHPVFSRLVGVAVEGLWELLGRPAPLRLVEVGAGDGTMARELIDGFERGGFPLEYAAVEISAGARAALAEVTPRVSATLAEIEPLEPGVVLANELLDNLPFRRARRRVGEVVEVRVGLDGDRLVDVESPADPELRSYAEPLVDGGETTYPVGAFAFVDELAVTMRRGYALLVDYGSPTGPSQAAHGYRNQRLVADVLAEPGSTDVTAGVDLGAIAERARSRGLEPIGQVDQSSALRALGYDEWAGDARATQGELLDAGEGRRALRAWDARSRAALLVDPSALGRLRWLLLSTPGLTAPAWFERARTLAALD